VNLGINFTQIQPLLNEVYDWSVENLKSGMLHDGNVRNIGSHPNLNALGQSLFKTQFPHSGFLAIHTFLP